MDVPKNDSTKRWHKHSLAHRDRYAYTSEFVEDGEIGITKKSQLFQLRGEAFEAVVEDEELLLLQLQTAGTNFRRQQTHFLLLNRRKSKNPSPRNQLRQSR